MHTKPLSVRVPVDLLEALDQKAQEFNCNRSDYVLGVLSQAANVTVQPRWSVNTIVDKRIQDLEERLAILEKKVQPVSAPSGDVLSQTELASRLNVNVSTISKRQHKNNFTDWTCSNDPDNCGWEVMTYTYPIVYRKIKKRN